MFNLSSEGKLWVSVRKILMSLFIYIFFYKSSILANCRTRVQTFKDDVSTL